MPRWVEDQVPTHDYRLGLRIVALAGEFTAADQCPDALDQQTLREGLLDVVVGTHTQPEQLVDFVILRSQEDYRNGALSPQLPEKLHAVHARHFDVEHGEIDGLRTESFQRLGSITIAADGKTLRFQRHRYGGQDVPVVVDESNCVRHLGSPQILPHNRMAGERFPIINEYGPTSAKAKPVWLILDRRPDLCPLQYKTR